MLVDKASLEIVVMPFVVLRDTPAAAARFELISAVKVDAIILPDADILFAVIV